MKKALITGINGFVGPFLKKELEEHGYEVYGFDLSIDDDKTDDQGDGIRRVFACDITDVDAVAQIVEEVKPDYIFHLAGFSSVSKSFDMPELCEKINVGGTKNLFDAVTKARIKPRILIVSSAEVYGKTEVIPINEGQEPRPLSPYGKSRLEMERISFSSDQDVVVSRSFNHTGPRQSDKMVIPSFKKQVKDGKEGDTILVGDLSIIRDFSDVRDVVRAYRILLEKGKEKEIYNVGSGKGYKLADLLNKLIKDSGKYLKIKVDENKLRKVNIPELVADTSKIKKLGIKIKYLLDY